MAIKKAYEIHDPDSDGDFVRAKHAEDGIIAVEGPGMGVCVEMTLYQARVLADVLVELAEGV